MTNQLIAIHCTVDDWTHWKTPTVEELSPSNAFWWRALCKHLHKADSADALDAFLPVAADFSEMLGQVAKGVLEVGSYYKRHEHEKMAHILIHETMCTCMHMHAHATLDFDATNSLLPLFLLCS